MMLLELLVLTLLLMMPLVLMLALLLVMALVLMLVLLLRVLLRLLLLLVMALVLLLVLLLRVLLRLLLLLKCIQLLGAFGRGRWDRTFAMIGIFFCCQGGESAEIKMMLQALERQIRYPELEHTEMAFQYQE
jgi:hypothetical protein